MKDDARVKTATRRFFAALSSMDEHMALVALDGGAKPFRKAQADGSARSKVGVVNPLMWTLGFGMERATLILSQQASTEDLRWGTAYGWTPLTSAALAGNLGVLKIISRVDDPALCRHSGGVTALMCAAESGDLPCLEFLLPLSVLDARDKFGLSALEFAAKGRSLPVIDRLAGLGLPLESGLGATALMVAAERGDLAIVEHLLTLCDPLAADPRGGQTALDIALGEIRAAPEIVDAIALKCGAEAIFRALLEAREARVELPRCRRALAHFEAGTIELSLDVAGKSKPARSL